MYYLASARMAKLILSLSLTPVQTEMIYARVFWRQALLSLANYVAMIVGP